jgi:pimeloyl-ACP methyl ester carboxylesterase
MQSDKKALWRKLFLAVVGLLLISSARAQPTTGVSEPKDVEYRATLETVQIPSHGALLNGFVYVASAPNEHPALILLHGLPGNERNLDLAQDIRRAGWDVLYLDYRGSWGTAGDFSFMHGIEDVRAAIAYLRNPENARRLRLDPARIVLLGHSMGGFLAVQAIAQDRSIRAAILISPVDLGGSVPSSYPKEYEGKILDGITRGIAAQGLSPLSGCTPDGLARELLANADRWKFVNQANALKDRSILLLTSNDGFASGSNSLAAALQSAGDRDITLQHIATDHSYSDKRQFLSENILRWLTADTQHQ